MKNVVKAVKWCFRISVAITLVAGLDVLVAKATHSESWGTLSAALAFFIFGIASCLLGLLYIVFSTFNKKQ